MSDRRNNVFLLFHNRIMHRNNTLANENIIVIIFAKMTISQIIINFLQIIVFEG